MITGATNLDGTRLLSLSISMQRRLCAKLRTLSFRATLPLLRRLQLERSSDGSCLLSLPPRQTSGPTPAPEMDWRHLRLHWTCKQRLSLTVYASARADHLRHSDATDDSLCSRQSSSCCRLRAGVPYVSMSSIAGAIIDNSTTTAALFSMQRRSATLGRFHWQCRCTMPAARRRSSNGSSLLSLPPRRTLGPPPPPAELDWRPLIGIGPHAGSSSD